MNYKEIKKFVESGRELVSISNLSDEVKYDLHALMDSPSKITDEDILLQLKIKYGDNTSLPVFSELKDYHQIYDSFKSTLSTKSTKELIKKYFPDFSQLLKKVSIHSVYSYKEILMQEMIVKCVKRLQSIESRMDADKIEVNKEKLVIDYIDEVRSLIELMNKLEDDAKKDKAYIVNMIYTELEPLLKAVQLTINEVCPEKSAQFRESLKNRLGDVLTRFGKGLDVSSDGSVSSDLLALEEIREQAEKEEPVYVLTPEIEEREKKNPYLSYNTPEEVLVEAKPDEKPVQ